MAKKQFNPGLRRSQAITTFGPGAIIDLRYSSAMMAGLDFWPDDAPHIHEPNLERLLNKEEFRLPPTREQNRGKNIPAVIFPRWLVCPKCDRLAPYEKFTQGMHRKGTPVKCNSCGFRTFPARLIIACEHGHIDDFPWVEWVHRQNNQEICKNPTLFLKSRGFSSSLADLELSCETCGAQTNMGGATQKQKLTFLKCEGNRPWLLDNEECGAPVHPLQRGASNVYFPRLTGSISIPPWSDALFTSLDFHWRTLKNIKDHIFLAQLIESLNLPEKLNRSSEDILRAIQLRQAKESGNKEKFSEKELRYLECRALQHPEQAEIDSRSEFAATKTDVSPELKGLLSQVTLINRLREVRALVGFTRIESPDPSTIMSRHIPISRTQKKWAPAIEIRGEGIYIELSEPAVQKWERHPEVKSRANKLNSSYIAMCNRRGWKIEEEITPRFLLVHSLAHIMIRQLSIESGYSSAALRERLYAYEPKNPISGQGVAGFLIYTSTADSEGSLGGLVRQGKPDRLYETIYNAIQESIWCSSDPLCIESNGQGPDSTNLAACHTCLLLPETCCEQFNRYLDRGMLIGTLDNSMLGFFSDLVE